MPRKRKSYLLVGSNLNNEAYKKKTISHYFATSKCIACEESAVAKVCGECQKNPQKLAMTMGTMINQLQRKYNYLEKVRKEMECKLILRYVKISPFVFVDLQVMCFAK